MVPEETPLVDRKSREINAAGADALDDERMLARGVRPSLEQAPDAPGQGGAWGTAQAPLGIDRGRPDPGGARA